MCTDCTLVDAMTACCWTRARRSQDSFVRASEPCLDCTMQGSVPSSGLGTSTPTANTAGLAHRPIRPVRMLPQLSRHLLPRSHMQSAVCHVQGLGEYLLQGKHYAATLGKVQPQHHAPPPVDSIWWLWLCTLLAIHHVPFVLHMCLLLRLCW